MSDRFNPLSFGQLCAWIDGELEQAGSVFGLPRELVFVPSADDRFATSACSHRLETPFGVAATAWLPAPLAFLRVDELSVWLMQVPVTAGWRAILIGIALGVIAMSLRLILGLERHPFGGARR